MLDPLRSDARQLLVTAGRLTGVLDFATWLRGRGRALSMALSQLPYYRDTNPIISANARYVITEVLAAM